MGGHIFFEKDIMKKRNFLLTLMLALCCMAAKAVPAYPVKRTAMLSNGTQVTLTFRGDEHISFYTDDKGNAYQINAKGIAEPIDFKEVSRIWTERMAKANLRRAKRASQRNMAITRVGEPGSTLTGKKKGLVILMEYQDVKFTTENAHEVFDNVFNKEGLNDYGMTASVKDYFKAQSYGLFELDFDVVGPYTATQKMAYYGAPEGNAHDKNPGALIQEGCQIADKEVDFKDYDWDGDGEVDQVFVIYAGYGENYGGADENTIWPHESHLYLPNGASLILDDTKVSTYACSAELQGIKGTTLSGIGTACHEFSHCLGLPDFYNTADQNASYGMGRWDVMDTGSYNNNGNTPAGYTSYERMFAGWLTPIELKDMTRINDMKPLTEAPEAYILYNEGNRDEYYLLENRQKTGFDAALNGHGLLVLHVDYNKGDWTSNSVNANKNHQGLTPIPADNKLSSSSEPGDPFPGTSGVTELTNYTTPAAELYNKNSDGSLFMNKPIDNIKESEDGLISFVACRPELGIPEPGEGTYVEGTNSFKVTWPAVAGATSYELELTEMGMASDDPKEALKREFDFEKTVSKSAGLSDIAKKLGDYGLSSWSGEKLFTSPNKLRIGTSSAKGYLQTPNWYMTPSGELTLVLGCDVFKEGTPVKGKVVFKPFNQGDYTADIVAEEVPFEITGNTKLVFHFATRKEGYRLEIRPDAQMYVNYLAIYDGIWTAEQLGIGASAARATARRATTVTNYTTDTNSYTFENMNTKSRYFYRVRAFGEEGTVSKWSEEKAFTFPATGIRSIIADELRQQTFDLNGRRIETPQKGLYIRNGKKYLK